MSLVRRGESSKRVLQKTTKTHSAGRSASACHFDTHVHNLVTTNRMATISVLTAAVWDAYIEQGYFAAKPQTSLIDFFA